MRNLIFACALVIYNISFLFAQIPSGKERIESSNSEFELEMVDLINKARKKKGLKPLVWNDELAYAARYHANDMYKDVYFEHDSYDKVNRRLKKVLPTFDRVRKFLPKTVSPSTENIGAGQATAKEMFTDWLNSKGHRENMFDPTSKYIGIGYLYFEEDGEELNHYWVMDMGR